MNYCEDCGQGTNNGICSNCQEELYIETYQSDFISEPLSSEFRKEARDQEVYLNSRAKRNRL